MISQEQRRCVPLVWVCFWRAKSSGQIDALNAENGGELTELSGDLPTSLLLPQKTRKNSGTTREFAVVLGSNWSAKYSGQIDRLNAENGEELTELSGDLSTSFLPHQKLETTRKQRGHLPSSWARCEELNPAVRSTAWTWKTARYSLRYTPGGPYPHIGRWEPKRPKLLAGSWAGRLWAWRAGLGWQFQGGGMCTEWSERNRRWGRMRRAQLINKAKPKMEEAGDRRTLTGKGTSSEHPLRKQDLGFIPFYSLRFIIYKHDYSGKECYF